jgi:hypothetical protein
MLGWNIGVYRQQSYGKSPAPFSAAHGQCLAIWQTGMNGLDWIETLVKEQKAISLGGNGYPVEFTAMAMYLTPFLQEGPPYARSPWTHSRDDVLLPGWIGKTVKDLVALHACRPEEWLLVEAWDES